MKTNFKAPQKALRSSWKGIESFTQGNTKVSGIKVTTYSRGTRPHTTQKHWGQYVSGSSTQQSNQY